MAFCIGDSLYDFARVQLIEVDADVAGQRLDNFLIKILKGVPKSRIYRIVRSGEVRVNKGRAKPGQKLELGDIVRLPPIKVAERQTVTLGQQAGQRLLNSIVYEDDGLMVINKPEGMAVHGGSGLTSGLIETLRAALPDARFLELVHRLDRATSGCLLVAKKASVLRELHEQIRANKMGKFYLALVNGKWDKGRQLVNAPLLKLTAAGGERQVIVSAEGKRSVSHFSVVERLRGASLLEVKLETGRTHQIRVHTQSAGHPILGDDKYGDFEANRRFRDSGLKRLFLHAARLQFVSPTTGKKVSVEAPLPKELTAVLAALR